MDVCSASATTPFLDGQYSDDVVRSYEPPVAERHHADVGISHNVFFTHAHIIANVCSIARATDDRVLTRVGSIAGQPKHAKGPRFAFGRRRAISPASAALGTNAIPVSGLGSCHLTDWRARPVGKARPQSSVRRSLGLIRSPRRESVRPSMAQRGGGKWRSSW
jgi:hypothetical protein